MAPWEPPLERNPNGTPRKPILAVFVHNGMVESIESDRPSLFSEIELLVVDADTDGGDENELALVDRGSVGFMMTGPNAVNVEAFAVTETPDLSERLLDEEDARRAAVEAGWSREHDSSGGALFALTNDDQEAIDTSWAKTWRALCEEKGIPLSGVPA